MCLPFPHNIPPLFSGALAPVPAYNQPLGRSIMRIGSKEMMLDEQRAVLSKRHGTTISRRTILKSYQPAARSAAVPNAFDIPGVLDIRCGWT